MKLNIKRVYCAGCKRLVKTREEHTPAGNTQLVCLKCGKPVCVKDSIRWRTAPETR